ncbi:MAG: NfeD family protein [Gemmatimonadota bacterium]|nr:NfeD family protein [Gemmatimonadota bacterium]
MNASRTWALVALAAGLAGVTGPAAPRAPVQDTSQVVRVPVTGTIELGLAPFVARALSEAEAAGADLVVFEIDTPGGRVDAAWQIIDAVRDAEVRTVAWVNRRALSAGAMIALSADRIVMRPGGVIGAATPVTGEGRKASEKMVSAMRSEFRALAEERGLDPAIAEAMVDEEVEIPGVIEAGRLLTLTSEEAVRLAVVDGTAADWDAVLRAAGLADAVTTEARPNWAERLVRLLTHPALAPMLLSLGFLGLLVEIKTPTFGLAGGLGLLCLAAFFGARFLVNLAGLEELLLLGAGVLLVTLEILVVPGIGVPGLLGGLAILGSITLSMLGSYPSVNDVIGALGILAISLLALGLLAFGILRHLPHSRRLSGILLSRSTSRETGYLSAPDRSAYVGRHGIALTDLRPSGSARFGEERLDVVTEGPWIEDGTPVVVVRAGVSDLVVRETPPEAPHEA